MKTTSRRATRAQLAHRARIHAEAISASINGGAPHMAQARGTDPAALSCAPEHITADSDGSPRGAHTIPHIWPQVPWRGDRDRRHEVIRSLLP